MRFYLIIILLCVAIFSQSSPVLAQSSSPMNMDLRVSKDSVFVGETFDLIVHFEYMSDLGQVNVDQPEFPELTEFEKVGNVGYSQQQNITTNPLTGKPQANAILDFTRTYKALKAGEFEIPGIEIVVNDPAQPGGKLTTRTKSVTIKVLDVSQRPPDQQAPAIQEEKPEDGLRDIKDPIPAPKWVLYLLGVGGASVLLALAMMIVRVIKPSQPRAAEKPEVREILNPYERAIQKLKGLTPPSITADDAAIAAFYVRVSDVVKEYLGAKHDVLGFEATTWEITSSMRNVYAKNKDGDQLVSSLERFLNEVDLGKYARAFRDTNFMDAAINKAKDFIELDNKLTSPPSSQ